MLYNKVVVPSLYWMMLMVGSDQHSVVHANLFMSSPIKNI